MQNTKIKDYNITYPNKTEYNLLKREIFDQEIYEMELDNPTPYIMDIGGYIGLSAIYFKIKHPDAKIDIFEPNPNIHHILEENIYGNNLKDVRIYKIAIDKKTSEKDFYFDSSGNDCFSTSSFQKDAWNGKQKTNRITVQTEPLSKYIQEDKIIDLLKIDTEGNELKILEEVENKLHLIKNLIIEYHPIKKTNLKKILNILNSHGYSLTYSYEGNHITEPIQGLMLIKAQSK